MSMCMDYAVMNSGWTLMVFFFYTIFFLDVGSPAGTETNAVKK